MAGPYRSAEERQAIDAEAARLFLKAKTSDDDADWNAAYAWVALDPAHGFAFAKAEASWRLTDRLREIAPPPDAEAIAGPAGRFEAFFSRRAVAAALFATVLTGTALTVGIQKWMAVDRYRTAIGQERAIRLADGSMVHLNTASAIEVALRDDRRVIHLLRGEARFDVAHDTARPFVVEVGDTTVRAVGTAFAVRLRSELTELTVIQGRVAVQDGAAPLSLVSAGSAAAIRSGAVAVTPLDRAQVARRIAWQSGMIDFQGDTLAQAVDEFNRYRGTPIVIGDPQLAAIRIGGTFRADSSDKFVLALEQTFGIRAMSGEDDAVILMPAEDTPHQADGRKD